MMAPIITSLIATGLMTSTISLLPPNSSTISPNKKTKEGRPTPVAIAIKYPMHIKNLSNPSA